MNHASLRVGQTLRPGQRGTCYRTQQVVRREQNIVDGRARALDPRPQGLVEDLIPGRAGKRAQGNTREAANLIRERIGLVQAHDDLNAQIAREDKLLYLERLKQQRAEVQTPPSQPEEQSKPRRARKVPRELQRLAERADTLEKITSYGRTLIVQAEEKLNLGLLAPEEFEDEIAKTSGGRRLRLLGVYRASALNLIS